MTAMSTGRPGSLGSSVAFATFTLHHQEPKLILAAVLAASGPGGVQTMMPSGGT